MPFLLHCALWAAGLAVLIACCVKVEGWESGYRPQVGRLGQALRLLAAFTVRVIAILGFLALLALAPVTCTHPTRDECNLGTDKQGAYADCE